MKRNLALWKEKHINFYIKLLIIFGIIESIFIVLFILSLKSIICVNEECIGYFMIFLILLIFFGLVILLLFLGLILSVSDKKKIKQMNNS